MTDFGATQRVPSPGQKVFQRYTLKKILGRGGMGIVWLAHDEKLDRNVALKFLPDVVVHDPRAIDELKKEARRNLDLTHPHIVRIYDFVDDPDGAAIAMEYVKGESLSKLALSQPDGTFTMGRLKPWMQQFCAALSYAHEEAKVVHRDLKPANLMLDGQDRLKITDFGIARSITESVSRVSAQAGSSGTPSYMSPQQMMGELPSVADDIYSLGATLYELLTGKPPFYTGDIIAQVQGKIPPSVTARRKELGLIDPPLGGPLVSPEWEATIGACLAKERSDRPESAIEVAERLGLRDAPPSTRNPKTRQSATPPPPPPPPPAVRRSGATVAYAAIGILVLALGFAAWRLSSGNRSPADATRYTTGNQPPVAAAPATRPASVESVPPPAPSTGGLVVRTDPDGADVALGSGESGKSPVTIRDLAPGSYPLTVRAAGFDDWSGNIEIRAGSFAEKVVTLVRSTGRVMVTGTPSGAEVFAGDRRIGTLPLALDNQTAGPVRLTVRARGYQPVDVRGDLARHGELRLSAMLEKLPTVEPGTRWTVADPHVDMMPVPAGSFALGSDTGDKDEIPLTHVTITQPFWIGRTEVTQAQWTALMGKNPSQFAGPDRPVEQVGWPDAVKFCQMLTERGRRDGWLPAGYEFNLPTEAQWEYACRAGVADDFGGVPSDVMWYSDNSGNQTQPVGGRKPNAWGLVDMHGNVWEWCRDWYGKYPGGDIVDATGPVSGTRRVVRGGSWSSTSSRSRASVRDGWKPNEKGNTVGFRVVLVPVGNP
ncbi:MAG TPA: SUMF1/EgtB/PvdO family nonheme iron enzyme [Candidatus Didemnitutus sp.]|jgi:serine/threonine protein kinase/formylglycine-generating enzyme required for sulfatase activity